MKKPTPVHSFLLTLGGALILPGTLTAQEGAAPRTFCRYVPERQDDFTWENDKIAFRSYGPDLRPGTEDGGFDCWLKRVEYPIIDKWYKMNSEGNNYHIDRGEGNDPYHVGSSLGCGGIGLWEEGKIINTEAYTEWKVIKCEEKEIEFELTHEWEQAGHKYKQVREITLALGDRLFHVTATTWKDGELAVGHPMAVGVTTHDGLAKASGDAKAGWLTCWEEIEESDLGTGVVMDPAAIIEYRETKSETPDESHALFLTKTDDQGQVSWWAGYGWEKAGQIKTEEEWQSYLAEFGKDK